MSGTVPEGVSQSIISTLSDHAANMARAARDLADQAEMMAMQAGALSSLGVDGGGGSFLVNGLTVFVLACFVGYYVVWRVTPALHSPLMGITNAISSVIIVGALIAVGVSESGFSKFMGFMAVTLASVNIFGGFIITRRMLHMFKKKG